MADSALTPFLVFFQHFIDIRTCRVLIHQLMPANKPQEVAGLRPLCHTCTLPPAEHFPAAKTASTSTEEEDKQCFPCCCQ
jgi:hypothetical protein